MKGSDLKGTKELFHLYLRRDRFILPIWVLLPFIVTMGQVSFVLALPDWQEFISDMMTNPMVTGLLGPVVPMTVEGAMIWRAAVQGIMVITLGSILTVIRHTRTEEEKGRSELVCGRAVGRYAGLTAALLLTNLASMAAGVIAALGLIDKGLSIGGALIYGMTLALTGGLTAGIGALSSQLKEDSRGARKIALSFLGLCFAAFIWNNMRGGYTALRWLTPLAWQRITQPFAADNWWSLLVLGILIAVPSVLAYIYSAKRDLGAGLMKQGLEPTETSNTLKTPLALAWRLQRGNLALWAIGIIFIGGSLGLGMESISNSISGMLTDMGMRSWLEAMGGNRDAFMATIIYIMAFMVGVALYSITTVLRLRREEEDNLVEPILAAPVSRAKWMLSHLTIAFLGSTLLLLLLGLSAGLGWGLITGDLGLILPKVMLMSITKIPSVYLLIGIAAFLYGLVPKAAGFLSWFLLVSFIAIEMLWEAQVVGWSFMRLSPFSYAHYSIPPSQLSAFPLIGLLILTAVLILSGIRAFQSRSLG